jgi:alpha-mannosidase
MPVGAASVVTGGLATTLKPFQIRTFAVKVGAGVTKLSAPHSAAVTLAYDRAVATRDSQQINGGFTATGALPAEMLPAKIDYAGVQFSLGATNAANAVTPHGQAVNLPAGKWTRVYVLAAADGDQQATFKVGNAATTMTIEDWGGYVGQWDNRTMKRVSAPPPSAAQLAQQATQQQRQDSLRRLRVDSTLKAGGDTSKIPARRNPGVRMIDAMDHLSPGYIKPADIAWFASHHHDASGLNAFYQYSYLFAYPIDVPAGATSITLPDNGNVRILAMTVSDQVVGVHAAAPLYDTLGRTAP